MNFGFSTRITSVVILSAFALTTVRAEIRPLSEASPALEARQTITGVNSNLKTPQYARIGDEETWHRAWTIHTGLIEHSEMAQPLPEIDFSKSLVVAVVEKADSKSTSGWQAKRVWTDDEIVLIDFEPATKSDIEPSDRPENVFAFFVIPRTERDIVVRRRAKKKSAKETFVTVANLPARAVVAAASESVVLSDRMLNIEFAHDPGAGNYDGAVGEPNDLWNLASMGTTAIDFMRNSDTTSSTARLRISRHDGAWGIKGQSGIFHGYIYHNCMCVDLKVTVLDLPPGRFRALVYAHGDAPNQNALIEFKIDDKSMGKKPTANDDTWRFREYPLVEGIQFVTFDFDVKSGQEIHFISHRDGSDYSMFNAIQIVPITSTSK